MIWESAWILWSLLGVGVALPFVWRSVAARSRPLEIRWPSAILRKSQNLATTFSLTRSVHPAALILWLRVIGLAFWIVAIARPQIPDSKSFRSVSGIDMMLALDVSRSMQARDLGESNRLETARNTLRAFIQGRPNDRMGLVMFSGEAYTLSPPTLDAGMLLHGLSQARMGVLRDGTAIGDGLALAINRLRLSKAKSRVIVLLTDGDNNAGKIDPLTAGELAVGYGIRVYTIAVGRQGRVVVPMEVEDAFGNTHTEMQVLENALNTELLQKIAKETQGRFYLVEDKAALEKVFREIDQLERAEIKTHIQVRYRDLFFAWIVLGWIAIFASEVLRVGAFRWTS